VPAPTHVYRFGRFRLDPAECRLFHDEAIVDLSPRLVDLLGLLVARPGELLTKEQLLSTLWPDVFVTENALTRAISDIRRALGDSAATPAYVQTVARRGYRFIAAVDVRPREPREPRELGEPREDDALEPYRAWSEGRLQLETLHIDALPQAIASFERAVSLAPRDSLARAGLANARFMRYETTRASNLPARAWLQAAIADAREACALEAARGEAWATLAFILVSAGELGEAAAAARRAVTLEPGNWRHQFRLAHATWGEERLRAIDRVLALFPDFAFAHFLAAMVHIARRAFPAAEALLRQGAAIQDRQAGRRATFPAAGLHWLLGLVCLADPGRQREAIAHFERERAFETSGGLYAREFAVNAWHASGCACLASGDADGALAAFREALQRLPGHALSHLGAALTLERAGQGDHAEGARAAARQCLEQLLQGGRFAEAAITSAADQTMSGRAGEAAATLERLLVEAPPGFPGWTIPIEPLLMPLHGTPSFDRVLAILAERAA
jgi:DNA-binding winged helix-turn-helix (wHTH) protein/cytochrome c-type biogenesis protein CcmH/NrfG